MLQSEQAAAANTTFIIHPGHCFEKLWESRLPDSSEFQFQPLVLLGYEYLSGWWEWIMFNPLLPQPRDLACHSQLSCSSSSQYYCVEPLYPSAGVQPPLSTHYFSQGALLYLLHTPPLTRDSSLKTSFKLPCHFTSFLCLSACEWLAVSVF